MPKRKDLKKILVVGAGPIIIGQACEFDYSGTQACKALKAKTKKMKIGHRGANHPVKNLINDRVEITSQNHGFEVVKESLPKNVEMTHKSLFDNSVEGIKLKNKPVFSVQYHPESNPGPQDSHYLFNQFINLVKNAKKKRY